MLQHLNTLDVTLLFIILTIMVVAIGVIISTLLKNSKVVTIVEEVKTIQQQQLEFLQETVDYYSVNPDERRNVSATFSCKYTPQLPTSEGCAIGRKIPLELAKQLDTGVDKETKKYIGSSVAIVAVFNQLPNDLKVLGNSFLQSIQCLHDNEVYWDTEGLSKEGKVEVESITEHIKGNYFL